MYKAGHSDGRRHSAGSVLAGPPHTGARELVVH